MKKFWIDCVLVTVFVFAVLWAFSGISNLNIFNALNPIADALEDTKLTDYAFSTLRVEDPSIDTNIVIVNIGDLPRELIGRQIDILNSLKPKVIALDILFSCDMGMQDSINCPQAYDTLGNRVLESAIGNVKTMVLAHKLFQTKKLIETKGDVFIYDSLGHTDANLRGNAYEGFVNLVTGASGQEDLKICREVNPAIVVNDHQELAFSSRIAMCYDSVKTKRFLERENEQEIINYRGNVVDWHGASTYPGRYLVLDWDQALDTSSFATGMIKDKIVIMGFLGSDLRDTSWDDKFFTPLNKKLGGRARPDMYGVVIHANIVSMILAEDYINELQPWHKAAIAVVICFLNVMLFFVIYYKLALWFDTLSIVLQLVELTLFAILMPYFIYWFAFELDITLAMAVLALAGPCFEIYTSVVKSGYKYIHEKWLTKGRKKVLTP